MPDLAQPQIRPRAAYSLNRSTTANPSPGLQGSLRRGSTGGTTLNATTYSEVVCVAGHAAARVRLLTVTSTGTLTVTPVRPEGSAQPADAVVKGDGYIDVTKVTKYANGGVSKAVAAGVECVVDIALAGENYVLIEFACTANGSISYCDVSQIDYAAFPASAGAVASSASALNPTLVGGSDFSGFLRSLWLDPLAADGRGYTATFFGLLTNAVGYAFNGASFDRLRTAAAAVLANFSSLGASLVSMPGQWSITHTPAAAAQATITKAAGAAGVRHVCTGISVCIATVGTLQGPIQINLRDGATGAGTILWSKTIQLPVNGIVNIDITGLNIVGSAATAMTLETSAAPVAAATASVSLAGYDAQ